MDDLPAGWAIRGLRRSDMAHIPRGPYPGSWTACCAVPPSGSCACDRPPYCDRHSASSTPSPPSRLPPPPPSATATYHHAQGVRLQITEQPPGHRCGCIIITRSHPVTVWYTSRSGRPCKDKLHRSYRPGGSGRSAGVIIPPQAANAATSAASIASSIARSPVINASSIARSAAHHRHRSSSQICIASAILQIPPYGIWQQIPDRASAPATGLLCYIAPAASTAAHHIASCAPSAWQQDLQHPC